MTNPMDFKFDKSYPPEYAYLEDFINRANIQLRKMDKFIFRVSDVIKEVPFSWRQEITTEEYERKYRRARVLEYLEDKRARYRYEVLKMVSKETTGTDPRVAFWVFQSCSMSLDGFDERTRLRYSQAIDPPSEKIYKLFSEIPSVRQEETIKKKLEPHSDAIDLSIDKANEIMKMMEDTKKRRQARQHQRGVKR